MAETSTAGAPEATSPRALDEWTFVDEETEFVASAPTTDSSTPTTHEAAATSEETNPQDENVTNSNDVPDGYLRVRLRIGEQTRSAYFKATQGVQEFTEQFFADELANQKRIRLIYMGMLLIQDRTMGEYGIEEDGVIHAVINEAPQTPHPEASEEVVLKGLANPANTLLLTTGVILYSLWTLFYHYPHLFSWKSIFLLAVLSATHVSATVSRLAS